MPKACQTPPWARAPAAPGVALEVVGFVAHDFGEFGVGGVQVAQDLNQCVDLALIEPAEAARLAPSPAGLSRSFASGLSKVSRFSCMEFPDVHGVCDYTGPPSNLRWRCWSCGLPQW